MSLLEGDANWTDIKDFILGLGSGSRGGKLGKKQYQFLAFLFVRESFVTVDIFKHYAENGDLDTITRCVKSLFKDFVQYQKLVGKATNFASISEDHVGGRSQRKSINILEHMIDNRNDERIKSSHSNGVSDTIISDISVDTGASVLSATATADPEDEMDGMELEDLSETAPPQRSSVARQSSNSAVFRRQSIIDGFDTE